MGKKNQGGTIHDANAMPTDYGNGEKKDTETEPTSPLPAILLPYTIQPAYVIQRQHWKLKTARVPPASYCRSSTVLMPFSSLN